MLDANVRKRATSVAIVFVVCCVSLFSQTSSDQKEKDDAANFFRSVAATIYKLAWPTATYKTAEFSGLQRVSNGIAVVMKLSGVGLFGDDLWLKLGVVVNSDGIQDIKVISHDALFAGPFETVKAMGELASQLNREYSKQQAAKTGAAVQDIGAAVCIINTSNIDLNFAYHWGNTESHSVKLPPGYNQVFYWRYPTDERTSPDFYVSYDDNLAPGYTEQRYVLKRNAAQLPAACDQAARYQFTLVGDEIHLESVR